jgi:hypothetical protein
MGAGWAPAGWRARMAPGTARGPRRRRSALLMSVQVLAPIEVTKSFNWAAYNDSTILAGISQPARHPAVPENKGAQCTEGHSNGLEMRYEAVPAGTVITAWEAWAYLGAGHLEWWWWWGLEEHEHRGPTAVVTSTGWTSLAAPPEAIANPGRATIQFHGSPGTQVWDTYLALNEEALEEASRGAMLAMVA